MNYEYSSEEIKEQENFARFCVEDLAPTSSKLDKSPPSETAEIMRQNISKLAERGYTGINLPESLGGRGKSFLYSLPFHEQVAKASPSTFASVEASSGSAGGLISKRGSTDQKRRFVTKIIEGKRLAAFAVTERDAGTDLSALATTAVKNRGGWLLNGEKTIITNAPYADVIVALAATDKGAGEKGLSFFIISREAEGVTFGEPAETMGLRGASVGDVIFKDCQLPEDSMLGDPGDGFALMQESETEGRIRFAAFSIGIMRACLELALNHSKSRKVSGKPLIKNQEVSFKIADIYTMLDTSLQLARYAAWLCDKGDSKAASLAACAKLFASESANKAAHLALQIYGGRGYMKASEIERIYRDARFCELAKGVSEILRISIAQNVFERFQ
ncbi:MAG: 3-(aryl)acrylate reductase AcdA [Myxococcota bacterium]